MLYVDATILCPLSWLYVGATILCPLSIVTAGRCAGWVNSRLIMTRTILLVRMVRAPSMAKCCSWTVSCTICRVLMLCLLPLC